MIEHKETKSLTLPTEEYSNGKPGVRAPLPSTPRRRRGWGFVWLLVFGGLGYGGFRYYQNAERAKAAQDAAQAARLANHSESVASAQAHLGDMPIYLRGLGTVTAYNTVNVKTRVDGPIVAVNFKEGQHVTNGELLIEIDPRTYQAALDQAEGQLARDQAQLNDAQVNLKRYQALWDAGVIAKQQFDTQGAQVGQFQGTIEADKAAIETARLNLGFTKITAPMAGRIGLRQVDVGNIVHATDQTPMAVITQMQPIAVLFTIPADQLQPVLAKLRAGAHLPVEAYDRGDQFKIATGTLETVDNQIDPTTGTSRLKAVFSNENEVLFPEQFVNCRLLLEVKHGVVIVPAAAVQRGPQGTYVWMILPNGTVAMRTVTLGTSEGGNQQIVSGLAPGDRVVTDGQDKLQDGSKITVRTEAPPAASANAPGSPAQ
jgi:membrane fusion protein, multidrug efflux system